MSECHFVCTVHVVWSQCDADSVMILFCLFCPAVNVPSNRPSPHDRGVPAIPSQPPSSPTAHFPLTDQGWYWAAMSKWDIDINYWTNETKIMTIKALFNGTYCTSYLFKNLGFWLLELNAEAAQTHWFYNDFNVKGRASSANFTAEAIPEVISERSKRNSRL